MFGWFKSKARREAEAAEAKGRARIEAERRDREAAHARAQDLILRTRTSFDKQERNRAYGRVMSADRPTYPNDNDMLTGPMGLLNPASPLSVYQQPSHGPSHSHHEPCSTSHSYGSHDNGSGGSSYSDSGSSSCGGSDGGGGGD